ncbi:MAG: preprotein translocase subunit YajC [Phycisphaerae bacterium]
MSKRIAVSLGVLLVLAFSVAPAAAQQDGEGDFTPAQPVESDGQQPAGEQAAGNGEQTEDGGNGTTAPPKGQGRSVLDNMMLPLILIGVLVLMYVWMGRSRKKQEQKRKEMLSTLKKGDKIMSIGGILGTVIEARPDELIVKVDEANNIRMRFARWAVRAVGEEAQSEASKDQPQG